MANFNWTGKMYTSVLPAAPVTPQPVLPQKAA